jgi:4'-phosphopantetheinyl transferase
METFERSSSSQRWLAPPKELALSETEVHVWRARVGEAPASEHLSERYLSDDERARAGKFVFERDRRQYTVAHAALRTVLANYTGIPPREIVFHTNQFGKPGISLPAEKAEIRFNLSHSGEMALIAVSAGGDVGVDVEMVDPERAEVEIACRYFSSREFTKFVYLPLPERPAAFFRCWTRKEAFIKGKGMGLSLDLSLFDVALAPGEAPLLAASRHDPSDVNRWRLHDINVGPGYSAALAAWRGCSVIHTWDWPGVSIS